LGSNPQLAENCNTAPLRPAQLGCRFDQRIKHDLQIKGRAADYLEHVGGGGLLLQRLTQLAGSRLYVLE